MNLMAVQILTILFITLVLADLAFSLLALFKRLKRCGDMYKSQKQKKAETEQNRKEPYLDTEAS
jgi:hypothetical protein